MLGNGEDMCAGCAVGRGDGGVGIRASLGERTMDEENDAEGHDGEDGGHAIEEENVNIWDRNHVNGEIME